MGKMRVGMAMATNQFSLTPRLVRLPNHTRRRPHFLSIKYCRNANFKLRSQIGKLREKWDVHVVSKSCTYALPVQMQMQREVEESGRAGCRVKLETLNGCKLGIGRYPDFEYNAEGGSGDGIGESSGGRLHVKFDIESLYIPPLTYKTTKLLGLPLPPFLTITILPHSFQGLLHPDTGKVELYLRANFCLSIWFLYKPPPLQVETVLTTEEVKAKGEKGQRLNSEGFCKLVGEATVLPVNDSFLNAFLDLPTLCLARLAAKILISAT